MRPTSTPNRFLGSRAARLSDDDAKADKDCFLEKKAEDGESEGPKSTPGSAIRCDASVSVWSAGCVDAGKALSGAELHRTPGKAVDEAEVGLVELGTSSVILLVEADLRALGRSVCERGEALVA